jgi:hypothetical protein
LISPDDGPVERHTYHEERESSDGVTVFLFRHLHEHDCLGAVYVAPAANSVATVLGTDSPLGEPVESAAFLELI